MIFRSKSQRQPHSEMPGEASPARRPHITRAESTLAVICLLALALLGIGAYFSRGRGDETSGAATAQSWRLTRARTRMAAARVGNTFWILGGLGPNRAPRADAETFDLSLSSAPTARGLLAPTLFSPRYDQTAQAWGSNIYIIGGLDGMGKVLDTVEVLDTRTGLVTPLSPMPTPRRMAHSVVHEGKIYVVGGSGAARSLNAGGRLSTLEIYDIASNTWKSGAPMRVPRECDLALWRGQIIVAGGYNGEATDKGVLRDVESYDIARNRWQRLTALAQPISAHHTIVSGDWVFLFGDYLTLSRVLAFNARTGVTRELDNTGFTPRRHVVAVTHQNRAYIAGGNTDDTLPPLDEVQLFDLKKLREMAQTTP